MAQMMEQMRQMQEGFRTVMTQAATVQTPEQLQQLVATGAQLAASPQAAVAPEAQQPLEAGQRTFQNCWTAPGVA